jgi:hypothetical protein
MSLHKSSHLLASVFCNMNMLHVCVLHVRSQSQIWYNGTPHSHGSQVITVSQPYF